MSLYPKLVTIGVPFYKRLDYLSNVLRMVAAQDYPSIELIISDNGQNGDKIQQVIEANYQGDYKFRQNASIVKMSRHLNQIIDEASGEYFHLLNDDDEISPDFVSELVKQLERHPQASLAYSRLEIIDEQGTVMRKSTEPLPTFLSGPDFIRATWERYEFNYHNLEGFVTRTTLWKKTGGYPEFSYGNQIDNAAVIRLSLAGGATFSSDCVYRHRVHAQGFGWTVNMKELATDSREFLRWLDTDDTLRAFAAKEPGNWANVKRVLTRMAWGMYLWRWRDIYRGRISAVRWVANAFRMPFLPAYYKNVALVFASVIKSRIKSVVTRVPEKKHDFFFVREAKNEHVEG